MCGRFVMRGFIIANYIIVLHVEPLQRLCQLELIQTEHFSLSSTVNKFKPMHRLGHTEDHFLLYRCVLLGLKHLRNVTILSLYLLTIESLWANTRVSTRLLKLLQVVSAPIGTIVEFLSFRWLSASSHLLHKFMQSANRNLNSSFLESI